MPRPGTDKSVCATLIHRSAVAAVTCDAVLFDQNSPPIDVEAGEEATLPERNQLEPLSRVAAGRRAARRIDSSMSLLTVVPSLAARSLSSSRSSSSIVIVVRMTDQDRAAAPVHQGSSVGAMEAAGPGSPRAAWSGTQTLTVVGTLMADCVLSRAVAA